MSDYIKGKIEACLQLSEGKTGAHRAADFRKKVQKVTGLTPLGFNRDAACAASYVMLVEEKSTADILKTVF